MINQRKKFGRGGGEYGGGGGRGGRQVSSGSYGQSKKSLGTRLVIDNKYVTRMYGSQWGSLAAVRS